MAFNPFSAFRKHQKILFAVLTILCMFVFIVPYSIIQGLLGSGSQGKGEKVVTLYGHDYYSQELDRQKQARIAANEVILTALHAAEEKAAKEVKEFKLETPEKADPTDVQLAGLSRSVADRTEQLLGLESNPQFAAAFMRFFAASWPREIRGDYAAVAGLTAGLAEHPPEASKAKDQAHMLADMRFLLRTQYFVMTQQETPFYFGGGVKYDDLADFDIWKHQADKLGVVLTKADARRAIAHEAADFDLPSDPGASWAADPVLHDVIAKHHEFSEEQLATAVADEFRVRIAQDLLDGPVSGVASLDAGERTPPGAVSPYDFWKYYRDNRTTIKVAFLPVPVQSFVDQVTQQPAEKDLKDLFDEYRSVVPDPSKATPAFREPKRTKVEFVTASPKTPYYQELTEKSLHSPARFYFTEAASVNMAGGGVAPLAGLALWMSSNEVQAKYESEFYSPNKGKFAEATALFGLGFNNLPGFGAPAALAPAADESKAESLRLASAAFLAAADGATAAAPLAGIGLHVAAAPPAASPQEILRRVMDEHKKDLSTDVVKQQVGDFCDEMDKTKGDADKARALIQKMVTERGWVLHDKAGLDDAFQIDKDEALAPLKDVAVTPNFMNPQSPETLATLFFGQQARAKPGAYAAQEAQRQDKEGDVVAYWRSEDQPSRELGYDAARPRVLTAWKFQEARKLAMAAAQQINADVQQQPTPEEKEKFLRDRKLGEVFELAGIARIVSGPSANPVLGGVYARYRLPQEKIPYGPDDLVDQLLKLQKPGDSLVFMNKPATDFYVAILMERPILEFKDRNGDTGFRLAYMDAAPPKPGEFPRAQFWQNFFLPDRQREYQKGLMRQLREEASPGGVNDKGQLVLSGKQQEQQGPSPQPGPSEGDEGNDFGGL